MTHIALALTLGLALLWVSPAPASAQGLTETGPKIVISRHRFETTLILEVIPLEAVVRVDGRAIGTAGDLVARAIAVSPGPHTVHIGAPGFRPYVGSFTADPYSSVNQFLVVLVPE